MKNKLILPLIPLCALTLCSCSGVNVHHDISEYILEMPYKKDMRILQLNDIHIGDKDNRQLQYNFLDLTIRDANADLIVLDGDIFTFASRYTAEELFKFIDSYGIPWTATFGNHDEQCYFSVDWLTGYLNNFGSNCLFKDIQDDDITGNANFAINLIKKGKVHETIVVMDSNRYYFGDYFGYDYIKDNQIAWYANLVTHVAKQEGKIVPSIAFFHIPLPEFSTAWDAYVAGSKDAQQVAIKSGEKYIYGQKREKVCAPEYNSGMFDVILKYKSTNGVFCAHDHINNFAINYKGVTLSYGVNSTDRIYYDEDLMGGQVITLHDNHSFSIEQIFHHYSEVQ